MDYEEAVASSLAKRPGHTITLPSTSSPGRGPKLASHTKAEELSFRLFDGQCLQYSDHIIDGFYDIWGSFQGTQDNMPAAQYPSLETLSHSLYTTTDVREILVFDRSKDSKLDALYHEAKNVVEKHRQAGPLVSVEALAKLVSEVLGGAQSHTDLIKTYTSFSQKLSASKKNAVRFVGELQVGLSRHRCLLLKALSDSCSLPCRILRGDFYLGISKQEMQTLVNVMVFEDAKISSVDPISGACTVAAGAAGASGENSVAVVQFNNQEWMVELVTQPGRMYQLKKGTIPQMSDEVLWGQKGTPGVAAGAVHKPHEQASASSYPTMPRPDTEEVERSDSNSSGQKDGLQWSEIDGPTMDNLEDADTGNRKQSRRSANTEREAHSALVDEQLVGLTKRLAFQRSRSGSDDALIGGEHIPAAMIRQSSDPAQHHNRRSTSSDDVGQEWRDWREDETGQVTFDVPDPVAGDIVNVGKYGSLPIGTGGPARARVRGTDQSGRVIEFELEGLTLTSAHNLSTGAGLLNQISRQSEDTQRGRPLESLISRYRIIQPQHRGTEFQTQQPLE